METPRTDSRRRLLVIGWDAADWQLISPLMDGGLMPTLAKFVEAGVMGNLATLRPVLSPMLWTTIATGKLPGQHGIHGFVEPLPDASGVRLVGSTTRTTKALWNICTQAGLKTHAVGWYASHPAEPISGVCVSDQFLNLPHAGESPWPLPEGSIHPTDRRDALGKLRVTPRELVAADLLPFIPRLGEVDLRRDPRPVRLAEALAACASTHAVATEVLADPDWDVAFVYYDALDRVGHEFMPYHPPRLPHIPPADFEVYQHVMTGMYRFHDMMLDPLLHLAGPEATVVIVSDHGFHSDHRRPTVAAGTQEALAALWHRHYGILAMKGPSIAADERIYGATLLDVAPTLLALLGLPVGADMPGRPLLQAFKPEARPAKLDRIPSWDSAPGDAGQHPPDLRVDAAASAAAVQQLIDLGYLSPQVAGDGAAAAEQAVREGQFNLAVSHLHVGKPAEAAALLRPLVSACPGDARYAVSLATALGATDDRAGQRNVLLEIERQGISHPDIDLMLGQALAGLGDVDAALERLARAEAAAPNDPNVGCVVGEIHLSRGAADMAERAYRRAVEADGQSEQAHFGLGRALLKLGDYAGAADHALRAIGLVHAFPQAHYLLGVALSMLGDDARAITSIRQAIHIHPGFAEAHAKLAELLLRSGDVESAVRHRRMAEGYGAGQPKPPAP